MKKFGSWSEQEDSQFRTSSDNKIVTLTPPATLAGASLALTYPNVASGTTDVLLGRLSTDTGTNRLQNKDLSDDTVLFVDNADTSKKMAFQLSSITTSTTRTITIPDLSDTMVTLTATQTLTNKSIDADSNTVTNIDNGEIKAAAAIEFSKMENLTVGRALVSDNPNGDVSVSAVTATELSQLSGIGSSAVGVSDAQQLTNKTIIIDDDNLTLQDNLDATKQLNFQLSGLTTSTVRTLTVPDADDTIAVLAATQVLTNKSIDSDNNTITNIANADIKAAAAIAVNKLAALTVSRATVTDGSGFISAATTTATEIGYVNGVTSAIQGQIDGKQAEVMTTRGDVVIRNAANATARLGVGAVGTVLTSDGTDISWSAPAGTGDVSAAAVMTDNTLVKGDGGAKGVQDSGIVLDDSDNLTNITSAEMDNGQFTKLANESTFTITAGYGMVNSNMTITTGTTVTVAAGSWLDVFDAITIVGTLDIIGDCAVR